MHEKVAKRMKEIKAKIQKKKNNDGEEENKTVSNNPCFPSVIIPFYNPDTSSNYYRQSCFIDN